MAAALRRLLLLAGCVLWVLSSSLLAGAHAHSYTEEANTGEWGDVNFGALVVSPAMQDPKPGELQDEALSPPTSWHCWLFFGLHLGAF